MKMSGYEKNERNVEMWMSDQLKSEKYIVDNTKREYLTRKDEEWRKLCLIETVHK